MASDIFRNIVEQKINIFVSTFGEDANHLFKIDNKLIHPLEYGMYKERCAIELLELICDRSIAISDGFIISADNNVSTQCDIIMYRSDTMPIIDNGISKFFPVEIVKCIGEIKSTLDKDAFCQALVKMAQNKMMFLQRRGAQKPLAPLKERDEIISFLICNKLNFNIKELDFDEIYKEIPDIRFRHNMILSLQDGLLIYEFDATNAPELLKKCFAETVEEVEPVMWFFPHSSVDDIALYKCNTLIIKPDKKDIYHHIIHFLNGLKNAMFLQREYKMDIGNYLTNDAIMLRNN